MVYHGLVAEVAIVPPNLGALVSGGSPHVRALLVGLEEESVIWRRFDHDLQLGALVFALSLKIILKVGDSLY